MTPIGLAITIALIATPAAAAATCAPPTLTKIVTRSIGPNIVRGSFRAEPITLYRKGDIYLRHEEAPEPERSQHRLTIVAEPDIWIVNRVTNSGRHVVDPGPIFVAKAPIVAGQGVPAGFTELEFGCEAVFAKSQGREAGVRTVGETTARVYALQNGDRRLEILLTNGDVPAEVAYYQGAQAILVIRYDSYQRDLPDDPSLFQRPPGVTFVSGAPE